MSMEYLRKIWQNCYQVLSYWLPLPIHIIHLGVTEQLLNKAQTLQWQIQNGGLGSLTPNPLQTIGFFLPLVCHQSSCKFTNFLNLRYLKLTYLKLLAYFGSRAKKKSQKRSTFPDSKLDFPRLFSNSVRPLLYVQAKKEKALTMIRMTTIIDNDNDNLHADVNDCER